LNYNGKEFGKIVTSNPKKRRSDNHMSSRRNWQKFSNSSIIARTIACIYFIFGILIWQTVIPKPIKTVVGARRILLIKKSIAIN
jgi:hypothetical protein